MWSDLWQPLNVALVLFAAGVFAVSSLRAFGASRVLVSQAHRNRALWVGILGILVIPFEVAILVYYSQSAFPTVSGLGTEYLLPLAFGIAFNLVAFFVLNGNIMVAQAMDFFHRDTLRWAKTNLIVLGLFIASMAGTLFSPVAAVLFNILWIGIYAYVALVLIASGLRVRDRAMRTHMKWIGLFALVLSAPFLFRSSPYPLLFGFAVSSLVYYRATVSLLITGQVTRKAGMPNSPNRPISVT